VKGRRLKGLDLRMRINSDTGSAKDSPAGRCSSRLPCTCHEADSSNSLAFHHAERSSGQSLPLGSCFGMNGAADDEDAAAVVVGYRPCYWTHATVPPGIHRSGSVHLVDAVALDCWPWHCVAAECRKLLQGKESLHRVVHWAA